MAPCAWWTGDRMRCWAASRRTSGRCCPWRGAKTAGAFTSKYPLVFASVASVATALYAWHCPFPTVLSNAALKGEPLARESQLYSFTHRLAPHLGFGLAGLAWWLTAKQTCFVSPHFTGLERPGYHPEKGYHPLSSKTRGDPVVWRTSNHLPPRAGDLAQTLVGVLVVCKHVKLCSPTLGNYPPHGVLNA